MIIDKLKKLWNSCRFYVIADPADNSITLSKALFLHIKKNAGKGDVARVFVFRVGPDFGFMINPDIVQPTQLCDIQYNDRHRCIGFESLCPSVGKIFFDYNLPATTPVKLSVALCQTPQGKLYYQFLRPNEKLIRKYSKG